MRSRILFYGTPDFAVKCLDYLIEQKFQIIGVVTAPDKKAGRGQKLTFSPVKNYAISKGISLYQPTNLKSETFIQILKNLDIDLQVVVAFRMLPEVVWSVPKKGTLNLHASYLPNYRGAAPINWVIINGERMTGVSTFIINKHIDEGDLLMQKKISIDPQQTLPSLYEKILNDGKLLLTETIDKLLNDTLKPQKQYLTGKEKPAPKLNKENTKINWNASLIDIERLVRGVSPSPGAWTYFNNSKSEKQIMKILKADILVDVQLPNLQTIMIKDDQIWIGHTDGTIVCKQVQLQNKRAMDTKSLLNGYKFTKGSKVY